jgi:hypothetical protein
MKLLDLNPSFYRYEKVMRNVKVVVGNPSTWKPGDPTRLESRICYDSILVKDIGEAQSIRFLCPKCISNEHHMVECTIAGRGVDDNCGSHNKAGNPVRWSISGKNFSDLSLSPSIQIQGVCNWHGHVTNGEVTV